MAREERRYISYLLRLWQVVIGGEIVWRASLESPHTRERRGFADLASLVAFLEEEMAGSARGEVQPLDTEDGKPRK
jgi:dihydroorotase-like cyclic amidohydrolase